jgi:hypothetical protein
MMNTEFQQYRFARIEARRITRARLEAQFKNGIVDFEELEKAIVGQLETDAISCIPWRRSEIEQTGCRDGIHLAAMEFYWEHRHELRRAAFDKHTQAKPAPHPRNRPLSSCGWEPCN